MPDLEHLLHDHLAAASTTPVRGFAHVRADARRRRVRRRAGLGAVATVCAGVTAYAAWPTGEVAPSQVAVSDTTTEPTPTSAPEGPRGPYGYDPMASAVSCVEQYSPEHVTRRGFAFDGVVVATGLSVSDGGGYASAGGLVGVTFEVQRWYAGGAGDTVTVDLASAEPGLRLLVSGESLARDSTGPLDHPAAWSCGFTRYWDETTAAAWERAFAD